MVRYRNEAHFQTELLKHIKQRGWFGFKIADSDCRLKPADCVITVNWETIWVELKYRGYKSHPNILQHQENSCHRVWKSGGKYFFIEYDANLDMLKPYMGFLPHTVNLTENDILQIMWIGDLV